MIAHIEGVVKEKAPGMVVVDVGGVGFALHTTLGAASGVQTGQRQLFYTHLNVREDAMDLYGFAQREEKAMFLRLTSITGIGPKLALAMLSTLSARDIAVCAVTGDINSLKRVPGIGPKAAQRIILELKDKVDEETLTSSVGASLLQGAGGPAEEAVQALVALGYNSAEAARAVNLVREQADTADALIRLALKQFAQ